ncbi:hypothetical protein ACJIZ3_023446 [Penstemon smallii]|uniref:Uncharacterized protein n=1 Tax=Penstemon smallii TaxID=265156 RepID=A0ABD3TRH0_9LAMI
MLLDYAELIYWCSGSNSTYGHYGHNSICSTYSDGTRAVCTSWNRQMTTSMTYVAPPSTVQKVSSKGGYVRGVVTYMGMDDLVVTPMSTISSITLLNKFNVEEVGALQEKVVDVGMEEDVKLLKISLPSKNVLTDVFLGKEESS